jgi:hypothetical protein
MNGPTCLTQGCGRVARRGRIGYGGYCERCRQRWRRRGAADQVPIRKPEVERYVSRIKRLLKSANLEKIEAHLRERHGLLRDCSTALKEAKSVFGTQRRQRTASEMLLVLDAVDPVRSGLTVAALFLMRDQEPHRFVSDQAFRFQLVRVWRSQTRLAFGSFYDEKADRVVATYKPLPPRVIEVIAPLLIQAYAPFGARIVSAYHRALKSRQTLAEAFAPLEGFVPFLNKLLATR